MAYMLKPAGITISAENISKTLQSGTVRGMLCLTSPEGFPLLAPTSSTARALLLKCIGPI